MSRLSLSFRFYWLLLLVPVLAACQPDSEPFATIVVTRVTPTVAATTAVPLPTHTPTMPTTTTAAATLEATEAPPTPLPTNTSLPASPTSLPTPTSTPLPTRELLVLVTPPSPTFPAPLIGEPLPPSLASLQLVVRTEHTLWLWRNGLSTPLIAAETISSPILSSDGSMIAFRRAGELWVINRDGSDERRLLSTDDLATIEPIVPGVRLRDVDWIPGTHSLFFNTIIQQEVGSMLADDLHLVNADTGEWQTLLASGEGGQFTFSPDGEKAALTSPRSISVINADGTNYQRLLDFRPIDTYSEYAYYVQPVWTADSLSLRVGISVPDWLYASNPTITIWHLPLDGSQPAIFNQIEAHGPEIRLSPDLSRMIYSLHGPFLDDQTAEMHVANLDGTDDQAYQAQCCFLSWSLDPNYFVLADPEQYYLFFARVGQTELIPITQYNQTEIGWIDSSHFLFYSASDQLALGSIDGPPILLFDNDEKIHSYDFILSS